MSKRFSRKKDACINCYMIVVTMCCVCCWIYLHWVWGFRTWQLSNRNCSCCVFLHLFGCVSHLTWNNLTFFPTIQLFLILQGTFKFFISGVSSNGKHLYLSSVWELILPPPKQIFKISCLCFNYTNDHKGSWRVFFFFFIMVQSCCKFGQQNDRMGMKVIGTFLDMFLIKR